MLRIVSVICGLSILYISVVNGSEFCKFKFMKQARKLSIFLLFYVIASNLPKCRIDDQNCLNNIVIYYLKKGANGNLQLYTTKLYFLTRDSVGIPSLDLQPIDPLFVEEMEIVQGNPRGPVSLRIDLKNISTLGQSDLKVKKVQ